MNVTSPAPTPPNLRQQIMQELEQTPDEDFVRDAVTHLSLTNRLRGACSGGRERAD